MEKDENELETPKNRFLDLECLPEFKIRDAQNEFDSANMQKAKGILDELLGDPKVKGEIRKRILDATKLLED